MIATRESNVVHLPVRHTGPRRVTKRQLSAHLKRSGRWIELRVRDGMPVEPVTDRNGARLYDLDKVEQWLDGWAKERATRKPPCLDERLAALERTVASMQAELRDLRQAV